MVNKVTKDIPRAINYYNQVTDKQNLDTKRGLEYLYKNGFVTTNYVSEAIKTYKKTAEENYAYAANRLGDIYFEGIGIEKDLLKAFDMYLNAADIGDMYAENTIGWLYYQGIAPNSDKSNDPRKPKLRKHDFRKAFEWTLKSAEKGFKDAQYNVAIFYWKGEGTDVDLERAKFWMNKAANQDYPEAKKYLKWITANQNLDKILDGWFSSGEQTKKDSANKPERNR